MRKDSALTPAQKIDARNALRLLGDRQDITLADCVRIALHLPGTAPISQVSIAAAIDEYLSGLQVRPLTLEFYRQHLWRYQDHCGLIHVGDITSRNVRTYLDNLTGSRPQAFRAVSVWLRWLWRHDPPYLRENVAERLKPPNTPAPKIGYLTLDQCRRALEMPDHHHAVCLGLFAGIRMHELSRMDWGMVNRAERIIRLPPDVTKTGRRVQQGRIMDTLPDALWEWIEAAPESGPVLDGITPQNFGKRVSAWIPGCPKNPLRHTFATYHMAAFRKPGDTALLLGHKDLQSLYESYWGLSTQASGVEFWGLRRLDKKIN